jgi:hypothetical protein
MPPTVEVSMPGASRARLLAVLVVATLSLTVLPLPTASANPFVPYCPGSLYVNPDLNQISPELCDAVTGRVFPEALRATDFVSFFEFEAGMEYLLANNGGRAEMIEVGRSFGIPNTVTGTHDRFPIYIIEVTDHSSPLPMDERIELLFMLSIHGNEKGGREGGMRVIEDLVRGIGMAVEKVQNGAGLPSPLTKPTGGTVETYADYLSFMRLVFLFPNADGWASDEFPYFLSSQCDTLFCRTNGNGTDLNRQAPSIGWHRINVDAGRLPLNEPESQAYIPYLKENYNFTYATDIHGMLNHDNFVAIMMPAGQQDPMEMARSVRIAENLKQNLNSDPYFAAWRDVLGANLEVIKETFGGITAEACAQVEVCVPNTPVASGTFADWMSVWDAIGYTDSGFHGDWFGQRHGLNAPAYDIELAYNHITFDSQYEGPGMLMNDYHVRSVRHIVKNFMDQAALDVQVSLETFGTRTLYLPSSFVATNVGRDQPTPGGAVERNPHTKDMVYSPTNPYFASPADFFTELAPYVVDGDKPGVLERARPDQIRPALLERYDNFVIGGSAIKDIEKDQAAIDAIMDWVEAGGNLIVTDEALRFLDLAGVTTNGVLMEVAYLGAFNMDYSHAATKDVRTVARQMYEPVPLGYTVASNSAPMWGVKRSAFSDAGGDIVGTLYTNNDLVGLGILPHGSGKIQVMGALLPDPAQEFYHPFGTDSYATLPAANQILRNLLGWEERFQTPPVVIEDGKVVRTQPFRGAVAEAAQVDEDASVPGVLAPFLLTAIALLALGLRRGRRTA